jgi:UDP-N-acetylmuramate dehydrogenase
VLATDGSWGSMSLNILNNVNLAQYTSWLIGGDAEHFCLPLNVEQLQQALAYAEANKLPITILGGGSNVLISDRGIKGLTIGLRRFSEINHEIRDGKIFINCLAGTTKSELLKVFLKNQLAPALFLAGLPGDVGGGVVMNAGVAEMFEPREFMELVDSIEVMTLKGEVKKINKSTLKIKYRHTDGWQPHIVMSAQISWPMQPNTEIMAKVREANKIRLTKQPLDMPSCGSVFKNPEGHKVAQLIDQCGLKGFRIGDAQVSEKHANFIVNQGKATATDTWNLILHVQKIVKEKTNVDINTEVIRLGEWS